MWKGLFAFIIMAAAVGPAQAHWQNTRWGMTPLEVSQLPNVAPLGLAEAAGKSMSSANLRAKYRSPYQSGDFAFSAIYLFDSQDRLALVMLEQLTGSPAALRGELLAKYGRPRQNSGAVLWWDAGEDQVMFSNIIGAANVNYSPRKTANNSGL